MTFRPTLIERAYQLAESGTCASLKEVEQQLASEGFATLAIQTQLHGGTIGADLLKRCKASYGGDPQEADQSGAI